MFIDQADASYWLAAGSLLDEEERNRRASRTGFGLGLNVSNDTFNGEQVTAKGSSPRKQPFSRPYSRQLPPLPLNVPHQQLPLTPNHPAPFSSPRAAPPTPSSLASRRTASPIGRPQYPLPPVPGEPGGRFLQPPNSLHPNSQCPSPDPSSHPGSSLLHQPATFSYLVNHRTSNSSHSSSSSAQASASPTTSPGLGVIIISSFPPPPQRVSGRDRDQQVASNSRPVQLPPLASSATKPLPTTPKRPTRTAQWSEDEFRRAGELHAWSVGFDTTGCPQILPTASAFHRPDCVYASRADVRTDQCGCRMKAQEPSKLKLSTSAPNLLEVSMQATTQLDQQRRELQLLKKEVYRISGEVQRYRAQAVPTQMPANPPSLRAEQSPQHRRHIRLAEPGERAPAHVPTGPILLPSLDLAMPRRPAAMSPQSAVQVAGSPKEGNRSRAKISTVRAHNRDTPSPIRGARSPASSPSPTTPVGRTPLSMAGHHRQTSSKSSNYSSDSHPSSINSGDTLATSVESLALTPPKTRLQDKGAPMMVSVPGVGGQVLALEADLALRQGSIAERAEVRKRAGSPFKRQMAQMQAYAAAVDPFPYHLGRQSPEGNRAAQWTEDSVGCAM